jgi:hypothetical protein
VRSKCSGQGCQLASNAVAPVPACEGTWPCASLCCCLPAQVVQVQAAEAGRDLAQLLLDRALLSREKAQLQEVSTLTMIDPGWLGCRAVASAQEVARLRKELQASKNEIQRLQGPAASPVPPPEQPAPQAPQAPALDVSQLATDADLAKGIVWPVAGEVRVPAALKQPPAQHGLKLCSCHCGGATRHKGYGFRRVIY